MVPPSQAASERPALSQSSRVSAVPPSPARKPATPKPVRHRRWKHAALAVTILAIVGFAALLLGVFGGGDDPDREVTRKVLADTAKVVERYRKDNRELPPDLVFLGGPGVDVVAEDAWRGHFDYRVVDAAKGEFRLRSRGPDRVADTADDIVWPPGKGWTDR